MALQTTVSEWSSSHGQSDRLRQCRKWSGSLTVHAILGLRSCWAYEAAVTKSGSDGIPLARPSRELHPDRLPAHFASLIGPWKGRPRTFGRARTATLGASRAAVSTPRLGDAAHSSRSPRDARERNRSRRALTKSRTIGREPSFSAAVRQ